MPPVLYAIYNPDPLAELVVRAGKEIENYQTLCVELSKEEANVKSPLTLVIKLTSELKNIAGQIGNGSLDSQTASAIEEAIGNRYKSAEDCLSMPDSLTLHQKTLLLVSELEQVKRRNVRDLHEVCSHLSYSLLNKGSFD